MTYTISSLLPTTTSILFFAVVFLYIVSVMLSSANGHGRVLKRANPNTIQDKFLVGYQGWFTCSGDGPPVHKGHHGWLHWFNKPLPDGGKATFDLWPDVSAYTPSELFPAPGLTLSSGSPALLFSSRHPQTVQRHFHWMAEHSVDGAFYQRFAGQCEVDGRTEGTTADIMRLRDEVLDRVREAAEKEGRVWAVMYDVSGVPNDRIEKVIKVDWNHLLWDKRILDSPNYLKEGGRPVIALWGFGFAGRGHSPDTVRRILRHIRSVTPGGAYIMAGTPTHWRLLRADADPNPEFLSVWYNEFDAISPWSVGRFRNEETIDRFAREKLLPDFQALQDPANTHGRKVDYIPVVLPGASGFNITDGRWALNEQPRDGGRFLWRQLYHVLKRTIQAKIVYGAMWDEYDEGTAFLPAVSKKRELPVEAQGRFIALDADGYDLPPDWYMRIAGFAGEMIREEKEVHETFPVKDLQDYWSSRPKYEAASFSGPSSTEPSGGGVASGSGSGNENAAQTFDEWCAQEKEGVDDLPPPPPYTLEVEPSSTPTVAPHPSQTQSQNQNPSQQEQRNEGRPPVTLQTRPVSFSASQMSTSSSTAPSGEHERPQVPLASRPSLSSHLPAPAPTMASRPNALPPSSPPALAGAPSSQTSSYEPPYQVYTSGTRPHSHHSHQHQYGHHNEAGYAPMYIVPSPNASPTPTPQNRPNWRPNWSTHPHSGPQAPSMMSSLSDQFGRQSLHDTSSMGTSSAPSSVQWPPPEWGMSSQMCPAPGPPPRPPSSSRPSSSRPSLLSRPSTSASTSPRPASSALPPPLHSSRPGGPPSRPPPNLNSGANFGRANSTSPNPPLRLSPSPRPGPSPSPGPSMPSPGSGSGPGWAPTFNPSSDSNYDADYGRMPSASFPLPNSQVQHQAPYAHHMMPPSPLESASSSSAYPSAYPDVTQGYMSTMPAQPSGPGAGGFYMGPHPPPPPPPRRYPAHSQYPGSVAETSPGPGSVYSPPPQAPPARPLGHTPSISPGQIMPGTAPAPVSSPSPSPSPSSTSQHPQHQHQQADPASPQTQGAGPGPGGFRFTDAYTRTLGAVDKLAGTNTRKKIEGGIESLSSAGSKVYQRFRG